MSERQLNALLQELENSLTLLDETRVIDVADFDLSLKHTDSDLFSFSQPDSLLAKCEQVCAEYSINKPKLRTIHHLACSGGSLITKCFSVMPNTYLLSEVHPHSYRHLPKDNAEFLPSDIATLAKQANFPNSDILAKKIFAHAITDAYEHVTRLGGILILRDHSHSDFCVGDDIASKSTVKTTLEPDFEIRSIVTLRNPIDAYASLKSNFWLHFEPSSFDDYCGRVLAFLSEFEHSQIFFYEDFVNQPEFELEKMCLFLDIPYVNGSSSLFDMFKVTGDSGRKGEIIEARQRRTIENYLLEEIKQSEKFKLLCEVYRKDYNIF
ncbi:sulfotransferase family protein [Shewanella goraebulensis]|uniref:hypothetical protein n=1 Tax=Shewanella goraebulensis TaxID=3050637 RepID=UPI00254AD060|nr:hypothetical protein [Shewanella goraebulensis]